MAYLTVNDVESNRAVNFDAYINCSNKDTNIAEMFLEHLEDSPYQFKLFLPERQLLPGSAEFDAISEIIEERCKGKVIIILSENYESSKACQFVTQFAKTLDPAAQKKKLIPVIMSEDYIDLPRVLRGMHLIHYEKDNRRGWFWKKLANSIRIT